MGAQTNKNLLTQFSQRMHALCFVMLSSLKNGF